MSETQLTQSRVRLRTIILSTALGLILVAAVIVSAITGQLAISPSDVVGSLLKWMGIANSWAPADPVIESTLQVVRFPRIVMALAVGAALAVAGALMQAVFGNPLAEPGVVGVSSGAALGASTAIVFGISASGGGRSHVAGVCGGTSRWANRSRHAVADRYCHQRFRSSRFGLRLILGRYGQSRTDCVLATGLPGRISVV